MRCLEKNPADRPQTAAALLAKLGTITTPELVPAVAPELPKKSRVASRRVVEDCSRSRDGARSPGLVAVFWPRATGAKSLDPNLVAVVPFRIAGADPSLAYLREGMLDLLGAKLTGDGGPRAADPRSVMSVWRRQVGDERRDLPQDSAMLLARQLGAGRLLLGGIVGTQDRLVINASLLEVPGGGTRATASVAGAADSLGNLIDRLTSELLAREAGEATQRVAELTEHLASGASGLSPGSGGLPPRAVTGRRSSGSAARWSRIPPFALAALGLVFAGTWEAPGHLRSRVPRSPPGLRERLSPRDRVLLAAFAGPHYPSPLPLCRAGRRLAARHRGAVGLARDLVPAGGHVLSSGTGRHSASGRSSAQRPRSAGPSSSTPASPHRSTTWSRSPCSQATLRRSAAWETSTSPVTPMPSSPTSCAGE